MAEPADSKPQDHPARWPVLVAQALILIGACMAYANSFSCPLIFDDQSSVIENRSIRHLSTAFCPDPGLDKTAYGLVQTVEARRILNLSLALNYAISGQQVWSYHLVNLLIHILAGLTLFGIMRRTLAKRIGANMPQLVQDNALHLALAIALIWTLHPLQTESVTYISERAESLMGLFYLLTLYCFIRSIEVERVVPNALGRERERAFWYALSVLCCLFGMATKETMVTAPVLVILYDRAFRSDSFRDAVIRRRWYYLSLCCTWLIVGLLVSGNGLERQAVGFHSGVSWATYALTETKVIVDYAKLSLWPHPLVFDYGKDILLTSLGQAAPYALLVAAMVVATVITWRRSRPLGFLAAAFFILLSPTSSIVPVAAQPMAESRMYLPLAAVVTLLVLMLHRLLGRSSLPVFLALAAVFGWTAFQRNETYRTEERIWRDTVVKRPTNERAHNNLGNALAQAGQLADSVAEFEEALRLKPDYMEAHYNLGNALSAEGRPAEAIVQYSEALRLKPHYAEAHNNLGTALKTEGRIAEAITQYEETVRLKPDYMEAHYNLGNALSAEGRTAEAVAQYEEALRLKPDHVMAHNNLGNALGSEGLIPEAIAQYEEALRLNPNVAMVHFNLAITLLKIPGRTDEAVAHLKAVLRLQPNNGQVRRFLNRIEMSKT